MQPSVTRSDTAQPFTASTDPLLLLRSLQDDLERYVRTARERNSGELGPPAGGDGAASEDGEDGSEQGAPPPGMVPPQVLRVREQAAALEAEAEAALDDDVDIGEEEAEEADTAGQKLSRENEEEAS